MVRCENSLCRSFLNKDFYCDETFWKEFAPFMFDETRWMLAESEVDSIIAHTHLSPPAKVLDLCCGTGRHSLAFARRGFTVTGVDITRSYLDAAAIVAAVVNYKDPKILAEISEDLGAPMVGIGLDELAESQKIAGRGW